MTITNLLIALGFLLLGALICYLIFRFNSKGILRKAEEEAEVIKKNKIIEAKEKFIALKLEHENQVRQAEQKLHQQEQRQQQREQQLNQKQGDRQSCKEGQIFPCNLFCCRREMEPYPYCRRFQQMERHYLQQASQLSCNC